MLFISCKAKDELYGFLNVFVDKFFRINALGSYNIYTFYYGKYYNSLQISMDTSNNLTESIYFLLEASKSFLSMADKSSEIGESYVPTLENIQNSSCTNEENSTDW